MWRSQTMKYQWVVLSVTTVGIFMAGLDTRIVLIGLPTIAESLHAYLETLLWVTQGCQFALTIGLLALGRMTDIFGRVKIYNLGFDFHFGFWTLRICPVRRAAGTL